METENDERLYLISHFKDYLEDVVNGNINENSTINSLHTLIKKYYVKRIDIDSKYFDPYAFVNDCNDYINNSEEMYDTTDSSSFEYIDSQSESEESESSTSETEYEDSFLNEFYNNNINNNDILLYKKDNSCVSNLNNFIDLNSSY